MGGKKQSGWRPSILMSQFYGPAGPIYTYTQRRAVAMVAAARPVRKKQTAPKPPGMEEKCPCQAFQVLDLYWQSMSKAEQDVWNDAVKKPHMSGYQLWMKESLWLCKESGYLPACPSVSGGFSCNYIIRGDEKVPPEGDWIGKFPALRWSCTGPPDYVCVVMPEGDYATLAECEAVCVPSRFTCTGPPDWDCISDPLGEFATVEECEAVCRPPRWKCIGWPDYACTEDPDGEFETLEACQAECPEPQNVCQGCDPKIPDDLIIRFAGLPDSFAIFNGDVPISWDPITDCNWRGTLGLFNAHPVTRVYVPNKWIIYSAAYSSCYFEFEGFGISAVCRPWEMDFTLVRCKHSGCRPLRLECQHMEDATCEILHP